AWTAMTWCRGRTCSWRNPPAQSDALFASCRGWTSCTHFRKRFRAVATEIGFRDGRIAPHFGGRAFGDLAAEIQHMDAVGNVHHDPHLVLDHQHGDAKIVADIEYEA